MSAATPNWHDIDWASIGQALGLTNLVKGENKLYFESAVYKRLSLTAQPQGGLLIGLTYHPECKVPKGFTIRGVLVSDIDVPYLQDGKLVPRDVLTYRLQCALQGQTIDLQHGMTKTGLRATPELIRQLKAGTIIEVIRDQYNFNEPAPSLRVGARATVQTIAVNNEEYEDGEALDDEDLEDIEWITDRVWVVYLSGQAKLEAHIGLLFSDFVITADQTPIRRPRRTVKPGSA